MKNFKKIYALVFVAAVALVGVMFIINDIKGDMFSYLKYLFSEYLPTLPSIFVILWLLIDVVMVLAPVAYLFVLIYDKKEPFRAILGCGAALVGKYLFTILALPMLFGLSLEDMVHYWLTAEVLVPAAMIIGALVVLMLAKGDNMAGTTARTILTTVGAALVVVALIWFFVLGDMGQAIGGWFKAGVFIGMAAYAGAAVYCFLPMTKDQKAE